MRTVGASARATAAAARRGSGSVRRRNSRQSHTRRPRPARRSRRKRTLARPPWQCSSNRGEGPPLLIVSTTSSATSPPNRPSRKRPGDSSAGNSAPERVRNSGRTASQVRGPSTASVATAAWPGGVRQATRVSASDNIADLMPRANVLVSPGATAGDLTWPSPRRAPSPPAHAPPRRSSPRPADPTPPAARNRSSPRRPRSRPP